MPLAERQRRQSSKLERWVRFPHGTLHIRGCGLTVKPAAFEAVDEGSIPSARALLSRHILLAREV